MAYNDVSFGLADSRRTVNDLGRFIDLSAGSYDTERHLEWNRGTNLPQIASGRRPGFGMWERGHIQGAMVLKLEEGLPDMVHVKFFRAEGNEYKGRGAAGFMMRQLPVIGQDLLEKQSAISSGATTFVAQLDTRADSEAQSFFEHMGFRVVDAAPLYDLHILDVVMEREFALV